MAHSTNQWLDLHPHEPPPVLMTRSIFSWSNLRPSRPLPYPHDLIYFPPRPYPKPCFLNTRSRVNRVASSWRDLIQRIRATAACAIRLSLRVWVCSDAKKHRFWGQDLREKVLTRIFGLKGTLFFHLSSSGVYFLRAISMMNMSKFQFSVCLSWVFSDSLCRQLEKWHWYV